MTTVRRSPPTSRVVAVLDHFVASRGGRLGLSALARELDISKPTCLGILTNSSAPAISSATPGPALRPGPGPDSRRPGRPAEFRRRRREPTSPHPLVEQYTATCSASAVLDEEIMVIEAVGPPGRRPRQDR